MKQGFFDPNILEEALLSGDPTAVNMFCSSSRLWGMVSFNEKKYKIKFKNQKFFLSLVFNLITAMNNRKIDEKIMDRFFQTMEKVTNVSFALAFACSLAKQFKGTLFDTYISNYEKKKFTSEKFQEFMAPLDSKVNKYEDISDFMER